MALDLYTCQVATHPMQCMTTTVRSCDLGPGCQLLSSHGRHSQPVLVTVRSCDLGPRCQILSSHGRHSQPVLSDPTQHTAPLQYGSTPARRERGSVILYEIYMYMCRWCSVLSYNVQYIFKWRGKGVGPTLSHDTILLHA